MVPVYYYVFPVLTRINEVLGTCHLRVILIWKGCKNLNMKKMSQPILNDLKIVFIEIFSKLWRTRRQVKVLPMTKPRKHVKNVIIYLEMTQIVYQWDTFSLQHAKIPIIWMIFTFFFVFLQLLLSQISHKL